MDRKENYYKSLSVHQDNVKNDNLSYQIYSIKN